MSARVSPFLLSMTMLTSLGVTAITASHAPAAAPARMLPPVDNFPVCDAGFVSVLTETSLGRAAYMLIFKEILDAIVAEEADTSFRRIPDYECTATAVEASDTSLLESRFDNS